MTDIKTTTRFDVETGKLIVETEISFPGYDTEEAVQWIKKALRQALQKEQCWLCGTRDADDHIDYLHRWYDKTHPDWQGAKTDEQ